AAAALALGAAGVQIGTAYLATSEATISDLHRTALAEASDDASQITNLFSGKPARGLSTRVMREIGPLSDDTPPFPTAGGALAPLKKAAEANGKTDFSSLWAGQAAALARPGDQGGGIIFAAPFDDQKTEKLFQGGKPPSAGSGAQLASHQIRQIGPHRCRVGGLGLASATGAKIAEITEVAAIGGDRVGRRAAFGDEHFQKALKRQGRHVR
ncbi:MAG: nitronate monooxygenase, partial [Pseudomonadota bacterium]|nr:nitronate monooxygenase [Pseudomonadota bacterium]